MYGLQLYVLPCTALPGYFDAAHSIPGLIAQTANKGASEGGIFENIQF